jgi:hypothetical protein
MVLRARDFRLYTQGGGRLVDLWQNGGAAVLGHTPPKILRDLKNAASRGLYAPFPHFLETRFLKALSRLFPGRCFRIYASPPSALEPLFRNGGASLWRPFFDPDAPFTIADNAPPLLVPVLPGIHSWRNGLPLGLCVLAAGTQEQTAALPAGDILPPVQFAVAVHGVYDLVASPDRGKPAFLRIYKALKNSRWQRKGIYLTPKNEPEDWDALFRRFLDAGFLIPPVPSQPLILPGVLSAGEEAKLAVALSDY